MRHTDPLGKVCRLVGALVVCNYLTLVLCLFLAFR